MSVELRWLDPADDNDRAQAWALGTLAFGGDPAAPVPAAPVAGPTPGDETLGAFGSGGHLLAAATLRGYQQWWGGRRVPMGGVASVAVDPHARGSGLASAVLRELVARMVERGLPVSVLFPTAVGLYRPLGWEVVGSLDETRLQTSTLRQVPRPAEVALRAAELGDGAAVAEVYDRYAAESGGLLARGRPSAQQPETLLRSVVTLASDEQGRALGYAAYDRGRGYDADSALRLAEVVASGPRAAAALLGSLASWDSVAPTTVWRGPTDLLGLLLDRPVPPAARARPWMLRLVDPAAAVAARGFPAGADVEVGFALDDPLLPGSAGRWHLRVADGRGRLERDAGAGDLPRLGVRGLALLFAGAADTGLLLRAGLLDRPVPGLDRAFAASRPVLLDYF